MIIYNRSMKKSGLVTIHVFLFMLIVLVSCKDAEKITKPARITADTPKAATEAPVPTPAPQVVLEEESQLLAADLFRSESEFCQSDEDGTAFNNVCKDGTLIVSQSKNRIRRDIFMHKYISVKATELFSLEADISSFAADSLEIDQNQYGLYFIDQEGVYHAVHITGKYYNFETWSFEEEFRITERYNLTFSPFIKPAGQRNHLRLVCTNKSCDFSVNGELTGRVPQLAGAVPSAVGFFTVSAWDQQFGHVHFESLEARALSENLPETQHYLLIDGLEEDTGTFTQMGLSGAFSSFEEDGFHFSPVIPFGYYAAKAGPSLADISVRVTVTMAVDPKKSSSRYAGLICRSSLEGMYMAVIRANGTYTIFRDTPTYPLTLMAERTSDAIKTGLSENELRLDCIGDQIDFYINQTRVESLTDSRLGLNFGRAGLFTKSGSEPDVNAVIFSNFSIEEIL